MAARAAHAFLLYLILAVAATWPLARGLARDVAWDLGDSILNIWILAWDIEQIGRLLAGDLSRLSNFFDATIFYPAPLALAYSDHLVPQALQVLPVALLTDNPILAYNVLFLSTFVLSGLGMYFLVRELTGSAAAAVIAGLLFAFAPYRLAQSSHVQVLSSQWMPFVFYGLVRYVRSAGKSLRALTVTTLALAAQALSSGYHLLYFTPFAAAFAVWEVGRHGLWRVRRVWITLALAGLCVTVVVLPFLLPYAALRAQGLGTRSLAEVSRFSADVYSYATAFPDQRIWGARVQAIPKPEGELFPGLVPLLFAVIGMLLGGSQAPGLRPQARGPHRARLRTGVEVSGPSEASGLTPGAWGLRAVGTWLLAAGAIAHAAAAVATVLLRRIDVDLWLFSLRMSNINQLLLRAALLLSLLLLVSPAARVHVGRFLRDRGFYVIALAAAAWLSLGPTPQSLGRPIEIAAPYRLLYEYVPGYDGLRVPARFAMIVVFMLSVLGGYGAAVLARTHIGRRVLAALAAIFLVEATHVPFVVNGAAALRDLNTPEARLYRPARAPAVYHAVARQLDVAAVIELPFGQPDYDLRAMYYSTVHWKPLVNGYSGMFPPHYSRLRTALADIPRHPELSLEALQSAGATHAILHEGAYLGTSGRDVAAVLRGAGAVELFRDGADVLFRLPR
jgi:hypothetical protein